MAADGTGGTTPLRRPVPCAVPEAVLPLLTGPIRVGRVLARMSLAVVIVLDPDTPSDVDTDVDADRNQCPRAAPVLSLLAPGASGTPHGLRVPAPDTATVFAAATPGSRVAVGGGGVDLAGTLVRAARTVPSRVPTGTPDPAALRRLAAVSTEHPSALGHPADLVRVPTDPSLVRGLVGRGPGLTPAGDDLLAGLLCGLWATGRTGEAERIGAVVGALAPGRTTALSADLLRWAARGHAGDAVLAVVGAARAVPGPRLRDAVAALLDIGHTSGADLLAGLVVGLSGSPERPPTPGRLCPPQDCPPQDAPQDGKDGR